MIVLISPLSRSSSSASSVDWSSAASPSFRASRRTICCSLSFHSSAATRGPSSGAMDLSAAVSPDARAALKANKRESRLSSSSAGTCSDAEPIALSIARTTGSSVSSARSSRTARIWPGEMPCSSSRRTTRAAASSASVVSEVPSRDMRSAAAPRVTGTASPPTTCASNNTLSSSRNIVPHTASTATNTITAPPQPIVARATLLPSPAFLPRKASQNRKDPSRQGEEHAARVREKADQ